ncbi:TrkH family potassium uptake protein [Saccharospirillum salsuginis]|uniref:Potassium transporter n=1 Tax=Saccharospirillum salsuginis TaxID=418750 RepID=A0A918K249_9GAMM|nr:potassium transporter TrkG [Saccharospirillum salsuginis]GGX40594.1 potassium transporter [Saccharospirillum salsuginis]
MPDTSALALMRPVRVRVVFKYLGQLLALLAVLSIVPALVALATGEWGVALRYLAVIVALLLVSLPLARLPEPHRIERNEALSITALVFLIAPAVMSYPLMADGVPWLDAWFEAVSGMTTTGLSTLASVEDRSAAFLFGRAWMQWYGGLGIAVLAVGMLMGHRVVSKQLLSTAGEEGQSTTARTYARRVVWVYLGFSLFAFGLILVAGTDPFTAVVHALAAVSTGGFSSFDASLAAMPQAARWAVSLVSLAGAVSLPLYYLAVTRRKPTVLLDNESRMLLGAVLVISLGLVLTHWVSRSSLGLGDIDQSVLLAISAQSTAGFSSADLSDQEPASRLLVILAMLMGGSAGSTAGGFKLIRILIVARLVQLIVQRINAPSRAVLSPRLGGLRIEADDIENVLVLAGLWFAVTLLSWWLFLLAGEPAMDSLFEVVSAVGTVGLSSGVTRPDLDAGLKVLLCVDMLLGRLEIIALLVLLYPRSWFDGRHVER